MGSENNSLYIYLARELMKTGRVSVKMYETPEPEKEQPQQPASQKPLPLASTDYHGGPTDPLVKLLHKLTPERYLY